MWELDIYKTRGMMLLSPIPADFVLDETVKFKTKREAENRIKGENGWRETVDAPYAPMGLYRVIRGKRKLIWKQPWDNCWGTPAVYPKKLCVT